MSQYQDNRSFREKYRIYIIPAILAFIVTMLVRPIMSDGIAMTPEIGEGEVIIVVKKTYTQNRGLPEFKQVVAFRDDFIEAEDEGDNTIRRVIGLPGDEIEITAGKVVRNGEILVEDYVLGKTEGDLDPIILADDEIFVLGDNREESIDSRDPRVGPLKMDLLRGYCGLTVWPISEFGRIQ